MARIDGFLEDILKRNGSDLHFMAGGPPRVRQYGRLQTLRDEKLTAELVREALYEIMPRQAIERFEAKDGCDFAYSLGALARFRVNVLRHLDGMGAVFRAIPSQAMTLDQLKMPDAVRNLCKVSNGLILVTGKTGSGKSTTLAAMIDDLNVRLKGHILTIEDPIEFIHPRKNCLVSQREVGVHAPSFSGALHSALREDPDVVLVGELRDLETMSTAITAAEMGVLVMAGAAVALAAFALIRAGGPRQAISTVAELRPELLDPWGGPGATAAIGLFLLFGLGTCAQPHYLQKFLLLRDRESLPCLPAASAEAQRTTTPEGCNDSRPLALHVCVPSSLVVANPGRSPNLRGMHL